VTRTVYDALGADPDTNDNGGFPLSDAERALIGSLTSEQRRRLARLIARHCEAVVQYRNRELSFELPMAIGKALHAVLGELDET
jgi:hypothetical protein